jgi:hypothetical protein
LGGISIDYCGTVVEELAAKNLVDMKFLTKDIVKPNAADIVSSVRFDTRSRIEDVFVTPRAELLSPESFPRVPDDVVVELCRSPKVKYSFLDSQVRRSRGT